MNNKKYDQVVRERERDWKKNQIIVGLGRAGGVDESSVIAVILKGSS